MQQRHDWRSSIRLPSGITSSKGSSQSSECGLSDQRPLHVWIRKGQKVKGIQEPADNLMHNSYALIIAGGVLVLLSQKCNRGASGKS